MVDPIKPDEVVEKKLGLFPDEVMEAFNELIARNFSDGEATFKLKEVAALIVAKGVPESDIVSKHYLDVEEVYEKAGWSVKYDQPAYYETYDATFTFMKKKKR